MKLKIRPSACVWICFGVILLAVNGLMVGGVPYNPCKTILEAELLCLIIVAFIISTHKFGLLSEINIFLVSYTIFLSSIPIGSLFGLVNPLDANIISYSYMVSEKTYVITLSCLITGIVATIMAITLFDFNSPKDFFREESSRRMERIANGLFYFLLIISIPYKLYTATAISQMGYGALFNGLKVGGILYISQMASGFVYCVLIVCFLIGSSKESMKKKIIAYAMWSLLGVFGGKRATVVLVLLFCLWFYNKYIEKIKLLPLVTIAVIILSLSAFMVSQRSSTTNTSASKSLFSNGASMYVITLTVEHEEELRSENCNESGLPYSFGILTKDVSAIYYKLTGQTSPFSEGQTISSLKHSNYLGWELTYLIAPQSFLAGYGVGSSYVAEAYLSFGNIGIIAMTLIIFGIVSMTQKNIGKSGMALYFAALDALFIMPRACFFTFLITWIEIVAFYYLLKFIGDLGKYNGKR